MKGLGVYPRGCELDFLQSAVINQCDGDDGIIDGIIGDPDACNFDPFELVGAPFYCNETKSDMELSEAAAEVARAFQAGARAADGSFLWYGPHWGANLTSTIFGTPGLAATTCVEDGASCTGKSFPFALFWVRYFAKKDSGWDFNSMSLEDFTRTFRLAAQEYGSVIGTSDPDLTLFQDTGGKIITYHGLVRAKNEHCVKQ